MNQQDIRTLWHGYNTGYSYAAYASKPRLDRADWKSIGYYLGYQDGSTHTPTAKQVDLIRRAEDLKAELAETPHKFQPMSWRPGE